VWLDMVIQSDRAAKRRQFDAHVSAMRDNVRMDHCWLYGKMAEAKAYPGECKPVAELGADGLVTFPAGTFAVDGRRIGAIDICMPTTMQAPFSYSACHDRCYTSPRYGTVFVALLLKALTFITGAEHVR
jgi:hypothetical protein